MVYGDESIEETIDKSLRSMGSIYDP
jgi:hypothetical protein